MEPLHVATALNVQGTASVLKLAEDMPKLKVRFGINNTVHVSCVARIYIIIHVPTAGAQAFLMDYT
jgi:hypothetical protein